MAFTLAPSLKAVDAMLTGDTFVSSSTPSVVNASAYFLQVATNSRTFLQFDFSPLPVNTTGAGIQKAVLRIFVNQVTKAGTLNVYTASATWNQATLKFTGAPTNGTLEAAGFPVTTNSVNNELMVDVTALVKDWIDRVDPNYGIILTSANANFTFVSKESPTQTRPARLEITLAGSGNSIAGLDGKTVLNGTGIPAGTNGLVGDFYIDTTANKIYGPKATNGWGSGTSIVGQQGAAGTNGINGINGTNGATGPSGPQGLQGLKGDKGDAGLTGPQGIQGLKGDTGLKGDKGDAGVAGATGPLGPQGLQGLQGLKGDTGLAGVKGDTGVAGPQGPQGLQGVKGDIGLTGLTGAAGPAGAKGDKGDPGVAGPQGLQGLKGDTGTTGAAGPQGIQGLKGDKGETGFIGPAGVDGAAGATGPQGLKGDKGEAGASGPQGLKGDKGETGATGPQGLKGDAGVAGPSGPEGPQGLQGLKGDTGTTGAAGSQGIQGIKGDTGSKGDKGDPGVAGPTGPQGLQGLKGDTGLAGVEGPAGAKGDDGVAGPAGPQGIQGSKGDKGDTGLSGPAGVDGAAGATGPQGLQGVKGDIGLTGLTGAAGPAGAKGDKGDTGVAGPIGPQGIQGLKGDTGLKGDKGDAGLNGPAGVDGAAGATGPQGLKGDKGDKGDAGVAGPSGPEGPQGLKGDKGDTGLTGPAGAKGDTGATGLQGLQGIQGLKGDNGLDGAVGPQGPIGLTGPLGATGPMGPQGIQGPAGTNGTNGSNGINGNTVLNGTGAPSAGIGSDGDIYLDTASNNIYGPKTTNGWGSGTSIVGAKGISGLPQFGQYSVITNDTVYQAPSDGYIINSVSGARYRTGSVNLGTNSTNLDVTFTTTSGAFGEVQMGTTIIPSGNYYSVTGFSTAYWIPVKNQALANSFGTLISGSGAPVASNGVVGDLYYDTNSTSFYGPKTTNGWGPQISVVGPQGPAGTNGINGTDGVVGPQGPQGPQGPIGLTGPQGAQGVQGPAGTNGAIGPAGATVNLQVTNGFIQWQHAGDSAWQNLISLASLTPSPTPSPTPTPISGGTTETFGTGSNSFTIDFVKIGYPNNSNDWTGFGWVPYSYRMGKYTISQRQVKLAGRNGLENVTSSGWGDEQPATSISWYEMAAYVNWLNTSQGYPSAYNLTFTNGAWSMSLWPTTPDTNGNVAWTLGGTNLYRNANCVYFLPSENEWYKAAYYDPEKNSGEGGYWQFPTGSDYPPTPVSSGTNARTAVYKQLTEQGPAYVYEAGGLSPFGTMGQGGNMMHILETASDGINDSPSEARHYRGGDYRNNGDWMRASLVRRYYGQPNEKNNSSMSFRIARKL
jgi:hypothetical protein